jgi:hypothetical protein
MNDTITRERALEIAINVGQQLYGEYGWFLDGPMVAALKIAFSPSPPEPSAEQPVGYRLKIPGGWRYSHVGQPDPGAEPLFARAGQGNAALEAVLAAVGDICNTALGAGEYITVDTLAYDALKEAAHKARAGQGALDPLLDAQSAASCLEKENASLLSRLAELEAWVGPLRVVAEQVEDLRTRLIDRVAIARDDIAAGVMRLVYKREAEVEKLRVELARLRECTRRAMACKEHNDAVRSVGAHAKPWPGDIGPTPWCAEPLSGAPQERSYSQAEVDELLQERSELLKASWEREVEMTRETLEAEKQQALADQHRKLSVARLCGDCPLTLNDVIADLPRTYSQAEYDKKGADCCDAGYELGLQNGKIEMSQEGGENEQREEGAAEVHAGDGRPIQLSAPFMGPSS